MEEARILAKLLEADTEAMRAAHELEALPEAAQIKECRAKRKELKAKQDQVIELTDDVVEKLAALDDEQSRVVEKLKSLQETLDHTSDFRVTNSVTRDMEGLVKRQGAISDEQDALLERQIKIDRLGAQVADMLAALDHKEEHLTADFKRKGGAIRQRQNELRALHEELVGALPVQLAKRYEMLRDEKGGIGVGLLEDGHCSACRAELQAGNLARLLSGPVVTECPNCRRIFIVSKE